MILDFSRSPPKSATGLRTDASIGADGSAPNCLAETDQPLFFEPEAHQPFFLAEAEPIEQVKLARDVALSEGSDINLLREPQRESGVKGR
jgi:hypothetical protein